jgi:hypothetical protein
MPSPLKNVCLWFASADNEEERRRFLRAMTMQLRKMVFGPQELLIHEGDRLSGVYIVSRFASDIYRLCLSRLSMRRIIHGFACLSCAISTQLCMLSEICATYRIFVAASLLVARITSAESSHTVSGLQV